MRRELTHLTDIFQRRIEAPAEGANAIERVSSGAGPNVGRAAVFAEIANIWTKLFRNRNGSAAADTLGRSEPSGKRSNRPNKRIRYNRGGNILIDAPAFYHWLD